MASIIPKVNIELPNMKILKNKIYCPTVREDFLLNSMANTSVPSRQPPKRIIIPTPTPSVNPPKMITKKGMFVTAGNGSRR
ncbi:MAG: hypothetical protein K0Q87_3457, partial [Neobacillus sp.]|nr:hypothetical protein [Neobacillus sp.]